jgi:hypothetical protein
MSDMIAVKCRACGEVNFVPFDRDIVQIGVPQELYDDVIRLIARKTKADPIKRKRGPKSRITDEEINLAIELRAQGKTVRQIMAETGWSLGGTARRLERGKELGL